MAYSPFDIGGNFQSKPKTDWSAFLRVLGGGLQDLGGYSGGGHLEAARQMNEYYRQQEAQKQALKELSGALGGAQQGGGFDFKTILPAIARATAAGINPSPILNAYQMQRQSERQDYNDVTAAEQSVNQALRQSRLDSPQYQAQRAGAIAGAQQPYELQQIEARQVANSTDTAAQNDARALGYKPGTKQFNDYLLTRTLPRPSGADLIPTDQSPPDPESGSILAQTGLSYPAFLAITGQATKLPRDAATRSAAFREAADFANKKGVDLSTFASQYQAQNEVLSKNIMRVNQTRIMEGELQGTIDNLKPVADQAALGNLRVGNVARLFAGQEVNDPTVQQYAFQLNQLRAELAAYNGALQGRSGNSLTKQDYDEAERVIKNGLSAKGADGLRKAVESATQKMTGVMNRNIDVAGKSVWDLFGVGGNYKGRFAPEANQSTTRSVNWNDF